MDILIVILVIIRLLATGLREGCMWNNKWRERLPLGYHFWRTVDTGIFTLILIHILGFWLAISTLAFGYCLIYERSLQYIDYGELFHKQAPWKILKWEIPFKNWHMIILGILGLIGMVITI